MKNRERINTTFDIDTYNQIKLVAHKSGKSMSELVREWSIQGLNGTLTEQNMDFIVPIVREQLKSILDPAVNRLAALSAKTCVQAGAAAYLSAEAILRFVPEHRSEDVFEAYEAARKKAVQYMKRSGDISSIEEI